jgi:hypothetical protein
MSTGETVQIEYCDKQSESSTLIYSVQRGLSFGITLIKHCDKQCEASAVTNSMDLALGERVLGKCCNEQHR